MCNPTLRARDLNKLAEILQKHPAIILIMFSLSVISAVVTIALGWEQFYASFLSKEISLPIWLVLLVLFSSAIIYVFRDRSSPTPKELETIEGKEFGVQQIEMDGKTL